MSFLRKRESIASDIYKFMDSRFGKKTIIFTQTKPQNGVRGYQLCWGTVIFVREQPT